MSEHHDMPPAYPNVFACVILSQRDLLRIYGFPEPIKEVLNATIARCWPRGIQDHRRRDGTWEWKLRGTPWIGQYDQAVPSRRLVLNLLQTLAANGWMPHISCDLTKKAYDKDTLFFRACPPVTRRFFSVSFNESDKIRLIDSPDTAVHTAFETAVRTWPAGIQNAGEKERGCFQIKLRGTPWWSGQGSQVIAARLLALNLLSAMDDQGWDLVTSVDMSIGSDGHDLDTWFFASHMEK